ncbi:adenosine kinase [Coemansia javaensis]|uniref:Adenosine kinase n=1 Tax=Coemansia javaensis TaxID=2761396 RepID=A0A9W8HLC4_9FUNG|nr:adenosine kinase [Coemansia javaensis]
MAQDLRGALVGLCNPLLDVVAVVDSELLAEFGLKANDNGVGLTDFQKLLQTVTDKYETRLIPGGMGQNTLRGAQLLLPPDTTVFFGAVGQDESAEQLRAATARAGVRTNYMVNPDKPTGSCVVLVTGHSRSIVGDMQAAETYSFAHTSAPENWRCIEAARVFYTTMFFVEVTPETTLAVARHAHENGKAFAMNLASTYSVEQCTQLLTDMMPYTHVLFGNETEALALAKVLGFGTDDIKQIAKRAADLPTAGDKPRLVAITQGAGSTVVATGDSNEIRVYTVTPVPGDEIGDTNGAGDAFVGGFLAQYVQGEPVDVCVEAGHWLAGQIVRQVGASYPDGAARFVPSPGFAPTVEAVKSA